MAAQKQPLRKSSLEDIPLPSLNFPKIQDYKKLTGDLADSPKQCEEIVNPSLDPSDSDSGTDSSDEFDWDAEDDAHSTRQILDDIHARRGRLLWRFFMKLSRPVRTIIIGSIGAGILIAPLLIFNFRFDSSPAILQVHAWSLWLTIAWAAGCVTFLVVDLFPPLVLFILRMTGYKIEQMVVTVEVGYFASKFTFGIVFTCMW